MPIHLLTLHVLKSLERQRRRNEYRYAFDVFIPIVIILYLDQCNSVLNFHCPPLPITYNRRSVCEDIYFWAFDTQAERQMLLSKLWLVAYLYGHPHHSYIAIIHACSREIPKRESLLRVADSIMFWCEQESYSTMTPIWRSWRKIRKYSWCSGEMVEIGQSIPLGEVHICLNCRNAHFWHSQDCIYFVASCLLVSGATVALSRCVGRVRHRISQKT